MEECTRKSAVLMSCLVLSVWQGLVYALHQGKRHYSYPNRETMSRAEIVVQFRDLKKDY